MGFAREGRNKNDPHQHPSWRACPAGSVDGNSPDLSLPSSPSSPTKEVQLWETRGMWPARGHAALELQGRNSGLAI